jgi:uncharacterized membrane protein
VTSDVCSLQVGDGTRKVENFLEAKMFGIPELIVLVVVFVIIFGPIIAVFYCRKHYPNRLWIGIILCLVNGGIGQFYLPGGTKFFFIAFALYIALVKWIGYGLFIVNLLSAGIIYWRYLKIREKSWTSPTQK